jgi:hypothetical protein
MAKTTTHPAARKIPAGLSKSALRDLLADALDLIHGEGEWTYSTIVAFAGPRLAARGDRMPEDPEILRARNRARVAEMIEAAGDA